MLCLKMIRTFFCLVVRDRHDSILRGCAIKCAIRGLKAGPGCPRGMMRPGSRKMEEEEHEKAELLENRTKIGTTECGAGIPFLTVQIF